MTKKRFTIIWTDNNQSFHYEDNGDRLEIEDVPTVLNNLHEQNERLRERLQIKDYALQKQSEITNNQQQRIKNLEEQLQNLRKKVNEQYVTWREWE